MTFSWDSVLAYFATLHTMALVLADRGVIIKDQVALHITTLHTAGQPVKSSVRESGEHTTLA